MTLVYFHSSESRRLACRQTFMIKPAGTQSDRGTAQTRTPRGPAVTPQIVASLPCADPCCRRGGHGPLQRRGPDDCRGPGRSPAARRWHPLSYDFATKFLARDRNFVRSLLEVVFCQSFAARDVDTVSLQEAVVSVEFDYRVGKRKIEIHYLTGLHKDDRMCVTIEGYGKNKPNFFHFQHSMRWANTRLLATRPVVISAGVD